MRRIFVIAVAMAIVIHASLAAQDEGSWSLGGSVGERAWLSSSRTGGGAFGYPAFGSATGIELRLEASGGSPGSSRARAGARAVADAAISAGDAVPAAVAGSQELSARFRELAVELDLGRVSIEGGRLIVNWSRGNYWSPVDIFADYDRSGPAALRLGADALALGSPLGATGALEAVAAPAAGESALARGRYALRASGLVLGIDGGLMAALDGASGEYLAGADFQTDLVVGLRGEGLCSLAEGREARFRAAAGADWSTGLGGGILLAQAEYCYDELPLPAPRGAADRHNAYASLSWAADRAAVTAGAGFSLPGGTAFATAALSLDAAQGASVVLYARAALSEAFDSAEAGLSLELAF